MESVCAFIELSLSIDNAVAVKRRTEAVQSPATNTGRATLFINPLSIPYTTAWRAGELIITSLRARVSMSTETVWHSIY